MRGFIPGRASYSGHRPTRRVRESDRSSRLGREAQASAAADVDGRAERPESSGEARRGPQEPDPDHAGEGNPSRGSSRAMTYAPAVVAGVEWACGSPRPKS